MQFIFYIFRGSSLLGFHFHSGQLRHQQIPFRFKNVLLLFFLVTQMIPMFIMLAPLYQLLGKMRMLNNLYGLAMLYTNMMIPFSVVTLCGFFDGVPKSLEEAAWIRRLRLFAGIVSGDRTGHYARHCRHIYLCVHHIPGMNFLCRLCLLMWINLRQYRLGLNALILKYDIKWGEMAAGTIMSLIPTMCLFYFCSEIYDRRAYGGIGKGMIFVWQSI